LSWEQSAQALDHRIRGLNPWPGTVTRLDQEWLRVWKAVPIPGFSSGQLPGTLLHDRRLGAIIQCLSGGLQLVEVQWENRKRITGQDLLHGLRLHENDTVLLGR
jgi:methionyl-tRNA formyltransferase